MIELEKLEKENKEMIDKRKWLEYKIIEFSSLEHRSNCPCCEKAIDFNEYKPKIEQYKKELKELVEKQDKIIDIIIEERKKVYQKENIIKKEFEKEAKEFYEKNKIYFNKVMKETKNNQEIFLPSKFSKYEEKLWNYAMQYIHLDKPSLEEFEDMEELFYDEEKI